MSLFLLSCVLSHFCVNIILILGTQPEVESCISRIKRRFNDVTLSPFDPANICPSSSNSSAKSSAPTNSPPPPPPPVVYTMPNISQVCCLIFFWFLNPHGIYLAIANVSAAINFTQSQPRSSYYPYYQLVIFSRNKLQSLFISFYRLSFTISPFIPLPIFIDDYCMRSCCDI